MKKIFARILLYRTEEGGRNQAIPQMKFGCPVFFEEIPALSGHGYDCRLLMEEYGRSISPGETANKVALVFLSEREVLPHLRPGVKFHLWEGGFIGEGEVIEIEE